MYLNTSEKIVQTSAIFSLSNQVRRVQQPNLVQLALISSTEQDTATLYVESQPSCTPYSLYAIPAWQTYNLSKEIPMRH